MVSAIVLFAKSSILCLKLLLSYYVAECAKVYYASKQ